MESGQGAWLGGGVIFQGDRQLDPNVNASEMCFRDLCSDRETSASVRNYLPWLVYLLPHFNRPHTRQTAEQESDDKDPVTRDPGQEHAVGYLPPGESPFH